MTMPVHNGARDSSEIQVLALFRKLLETEAVPLSVPFRDLGGSSFAALLLHDELEQVSGRTLPLELVWTDGSVEQIARAIREAEPNSESRRLVSLTGPARHRLYCVHAVVGMALKYQALADLLAAQDVEVRAFQARGMLPTESPHTDLRDMAAEYVAELFEDAPEEINLLGYSMGGFIAYDMARLIEEAGRTVANLFVVDTPAPTERAVWNGLDPLVPSPVILASAFNGDFAREDILAQPAEEQIGWLYARAVEQGAMPPGYRLEDLRRLAAAIDVHQTVTRSYTPQRFPLSARLTLLTVPAEGVPADLWWERSTGRSPRILPLPGPHYRLLDPPNIEPMSAGVRAAIAASLP